jgi:phospholipid transport system substrate-binding protein
LNQIKHSARRLVFLTIEFDAARRLRRTQPGRQEMISAFGWTRCRAGLTGFAVASLVAATLPARGEDPSLAPDALVRTVVGDVLAAVSHVAPGDREGREKALAVARQKVLPHIDFERMTRLAVGRAWRTADARQREALVTQFSTLITRTYSSAIDAYNGHDAQVDPLTLSPADNDVIVRSRFAKPGVQPVEVDYAMWKTAGGWKVYDITVENVSLVINYRSQFGEEVQRSGIDGLIKSLEEKNRGPAR